MVFDLLIQCPQGENEWKKGITIERAQKSHETHWSGKREKILNK